MRPALATTTLLLSSILLPAAAYASKPADDTVAPTAFRVSTGVTAPKLIRSTDLNLPDSINAFPLPGNAQVGVAFTVDEKGVPQSVHVVKSLNPYWDSRVIDAVSRFRYTPGTVDDQTIPVDMDLTVNIAR
jgi:TonB family protein